MERQVHGMEELGESLRLRQFPSHASSLPGRKTIVNPDASTSSNRAAHSCRRLASYGRDPGRNGADSDGEQARPADQYCDGEEDQRGRERVHRDLVCLPPAD
jgi:hypothetical protein